MSFIAMETGNPLGQRPLNVMARSQGMGQWNLGLGAGATPGDYDNNQQVLGQLVAMGAISQDDANNIWAGTASLDDMAVNMTMINQALALTGQQGGQVVQPLPPPSAPLTPAQVAQIQQNPAPGTAPAAPAEIPSGTKIVYTVSWTAGVGNLSVSPNQAISNLGNALPSHGMSLVSGAATSSGPVNYGISVTIQDTVGNAKWSDAQSVLDALMKQIVGNNLSGSQLALAPPSGGPASFTAFLENNAAWLVGGIIAIAVLPPLIRKL